MHLPEAVAEQHGWSDDEQPFDVLAIAASAEEVDGGIECGEIRFAGVTVASLAASTAPAWAWRQESLPGRSNSRPPRCT